MGDAATCFPEQVRRSQGAATMTDFNTINKYNILYIYKVFTKQTFYFL